MLLTESGLPVTLSSYYSTPDIYMYRIYGTNGHITCTPNGLRAEFLEPKESVALDFSDEGYESFILQMREFGTCIQNGRAPETGGEEGLRAFAAIEAMRLAAAGHRSVPLGEVLA
jgi:predicted dehydrogenase